MNFVNSMMILANNPATISNLLKNGIVDVMYWCKWLIFAVGAVMIITSIVFFYQHFKNHGKGQSKLFPAIALLILGCVCIAGGGALTKLGNTGEATLEKWGETGGTTNGNKNNPYSDTATDPFAAGD